LSFYSQKLKFNLFYLPTCVFLSQNNFKIRNMKRLITKIKSLKTALAVCALGGLMFPANAQAPWCGANNSESRYMSSGGYYYAAIEQTTFSSGGTVLYNKSADGYKSAVTGTCGAGWSLINPPSKPIIITAGNTYTIEFSTSTYYGSGYTANFGLYIDLNLDGDFTDAGEMLSASNWTASSGPGSPGTPGSLSKFSFKIPCNVAPGASRLRVRSDMNWYPAFTLGNGCQNTCGGPPYYGETDDYSIELQLPTSLSANFVAPTQVWVKTVNKFINSNQSGYIEHAWDANNDGSFQQKSSIPNWSNDQYEWQTPGTKCVKLRSTNCLGVDSIVKCFPAKIPTATPVVDFVADRVLIERYETVKLFDLSANGPYKWKWDVYDSVTYAADDIYYGLNRENDEVYSFPGNDETTQNPEIGFDMPGCYTVVLTATNDVGQSPLKKKVCYITVTESTLYQMGFGTYGPNGDNTVGSNTGTITDNGGADGSYGNNQGLGSRSFLQITPCNAKKITLNMTQLKFKDAGDVLSVWDGKSPGGPNTTLLAKWNNTSRAPKSVAATSGSMYILFESDGGGVDSGYVGYYSSELGPATLPVPAFSPSSVPSYNLTPVKFTNTTQNIVGVPTWKWTIDGVEEGISNRKDFFYTFDADGQYDVCLEIKSCVGNNKSCSKIDVVTPNTQTTLDFKASTRRPSANIDVVTLIPMADNANRFQWTIFPTTYKLMNPPSAPSTYGVGFINYDKPVGDSIAKPQIKFLSPGCYTITLKAWSTHDNVNTVKTIVKNKFICAVDYCKPDAFILSGDVGINRVRLIDPTTSVELINNYSTSGLVAYTDFSNSTTVPVAELTYGKTYTVEVSRNTSVDPANRKIWIDYNIDGDFDDANELIIVPETATYSPVLTRSFVVPALADAFEGITKMRVAINYNNENITTCGPITAGEYEDYAVRLSNDNMPPSIVMNGEDTIRIEVGSAYTDAGATAFDPSEGNITSNIIKTTDLDATVTGLYTYEYNVTDQSGNKAPTAIRTIIVVNDMTLPVLTLNPGSTTCLEVDRKNGPYVEPGATATDNKAPFNLTSSIVITGTVDSRKAGIYPVQYYVQDVAGNTVIKTRNVCYADTKAPVIDTAGENLIQVGSVWIDQTTAVDAYDDVPVLTKEWGFNGPVNTTLIRTYPVTYNAYDATGNQSTPTRRNYRVDDFIKPVINLNTFDVIEHEVRTPYLSVAATVTDNYYVLPGQVSIIPLSSNVNPNVLGTYSEVFEAIDPSGNVAQKTRTVKVVDTKAPKVWGEIIHGCVGEDIWPMWGISTTDNYYSPAQLKPLVEIVNQNVNKWEEGIYTITYRVTDPSGNTSDEFTRLVQYTYWPKCSNSTVSVNDVKSIEEAVSVYPNPSKGLVTVDLQGALAQNATVEVYNAMGQMILVKAFTEATGKFNVDLSNNATGVYTIKLIADGQVITKRVVLQ
jgi:hypothetical protein